MRVFKLIDAEKADYSISLLCRVLQVSRSGYYDWKDRPPSKRDRENAALTCRITEIHERSRGTYGYPHGCMPNSKPWEYAAAGNERLG